MTCCTAVIRAGASSPIGWRGVQWRCGWRCWSIAALPRCRCTPTSAVCGWRSRRAMSSNATCRRSSPIGASSCCVPTGGPTMLFRDRRDAGQALARALAAWRGSRPLVLAIPRGAVPIGAEVADALEGELDVVLVHKLGSHWNPEYAIGAIDAQGRVTVTDAADADPGWLERERSRRLAELQQRRAQYSPQRSVIDPCGRVAIVVDGGLATGATMIAAPDAVRAQSPARLICA